MGKRHVEESSLTQVANAIRAKNGTNAALVFPAGFASAIANISTGTDTTDATATAADIAQGKTAYANGQKLTGTYVSSGVDTSDATATAADIARGKTAYANGQKLTGTYVSSGVDTSDATATSADIAQGKSAYVNGRKVFGSSSAAGQMRSLAEGTLYALDLPPGTTEVAEQVFSNMELLEQVSIPSSVTEIGAEAFADCTSLQDLMISGTAQNDLTIGELAFSGCTALTTLTLPVHARTIESGAFSGCGLESVWIEAEEPFYASDMFDGCDDLLEIYVPWSSEDDYGEPWGAENAEVYYEGM